MNVINVVIVSNETQYKVKVKNSKDARKFKFNFGFIKFRSSERYRNDTWNFKL